MTTAVSKVGNVSQQIRGVTYRKADASATLGPGLLPVLRAGNITEYGITLDDLVYVPQEKVAEKQKLQRNDVLIAASSGSIDVVGKAARVTDDLDAGFGAFCKVLRPNEQVDPLYFSHYFKTVYYRRRVSFLAAGANINNLRNEDLDNLDIPLPPLAEQKRIAGILDAADALRAKRREALAQLDTLLQSTFLDMFGDPAKNPKGWPVTHFEDEFHSVRYGTGSPPPYVEDGIPFLRATNVKGGTISPVALKEISSADAANIEKCRVQTGNLIIVRSGVNTGDCAYVPLAYDGAYAAYDLIVELPRANAVFYNFLINSPYGKAHLAPLTRRAAQPHLNARQVMSLRFISPNQKAKERFTAIVESAEQQKARMRAHLAELDALFASLQSRAFNGELGA